MEILIDKSGILQIKRGLKMRIQYCPYTFYSDDSEQPCGEWCPHFGEILSNVLIKNQMIELCNGKKLIGKITDERSN